MDKNELLRLIHKDHDVRKALTRAILDDLVKEINFRARNGQAVFAADAVRKPVNRG